MISVFGSVCVVSPVTTDTLGRCDLSVRVGVCGVTSDDRYTGQM